eukprot:PhF_6_TR41291/c0_g2_i3/m.62488
MLAYAVSLHGAANTAKKPIINKKGVSPHTIYHMMQRRSDVIPRITWEVGLRTFTFLPSSSSSSSRVVLEDAVLRCPTWEPVFRYVMLSVELNPATLVHALKLCCDAGQFNAALQVIERHVGALQSILLPFPMLLPCLRIAFLNNSDTSKGYEYVTKWFPQLLSDEAVVLKLLGDMFQQQQKEEEVWLKALHIWRSTKQHIQTQTSATAMVTAILCQHKQWRTACVCYQSSSPSSSQPPHRPYRHLTHYLASQTPMWDYALRLASRGTLLWDNHDIAKATLLAVGNAHGTQVAVNLWWSCARIFVHHYQKMQQPIDVSYMVGVLSLAGRPWQALRCLQTFSKHPTFDRNITDKDFEPILSHFYKRRHWVDALNVFAIAKSFTAAFGSTTTTTTTMSSSSSSSSLLLRYIVATLPQQLETHPLYCAARRSEILDLLLLSGKKDNFFFQFLRPQEL